MRLKLFLTVLSGAFLSHAAIAQMPDAPSSPDAPPPVTTPETPPVETPPEDAAPVESTPEGAPKEVTDAAAAKQWKDPGPWPDPASDPSNILYLDLSTGGRVTIQLRPDVAPVHVERIKALVARGFYNNVVFHRVIDGFMAQTGDPTGTGEGGSDLPDINAEFNLIPHLRGTVSMARTSDPNSANSQFFIMFMPRTTLDRKYTVFGRVIAGMQYVDAIERGEPPAEPSRILRASLASDNVPPPPPAPPAQPAEAPQPQ